MCCYLITGLTADTIASTVRAVCGLGQLKQLMNTINAIYLLICANLIILLFWTVSCVRDCRIS